MTNTPTTPAGWYPDPRGGPHPRWWDGNQWTENVQEPYSAASAGAIPAAAAGTKVYNPWIWLVVFLPFISLPLLFTIDFGTLLNPAYVNDDQAAMEAQLAILTSPGVVAVTLVSWLAAAATIFCAYRDWKWLVAAGVPKPFHWAWSFIGLAGYPVYAIGRAVITKRRTGHGSAVLWATIGMIVLSVIVAIAWSVSLVAGMVEQMGPLGP